MKCILNTETGNIRKLKDADGRDLVRTNIKFQFVPKWMWKDQQGKPYKGERIGQTTD